MTQTVYRKYSSLFKIRIKCWADGRENGDGKDLFPLTGCGSIYNWFCSSNILGLVLFSFDFSFFLVCIQGQLDHSWGVLTLAAVHPANRWEVPWWPTIAGRQEVSNRDRLTSLPAADRPAIKGRPSVDLQVYNNPHLFISVSVLYQPATVSLL